jgi:hypothetical protein
MTKIMMPMSHLKIAIFSGLSYCVFMTYAISINTVFTDEGMPWAVGLFLGVTFGICTYYGLRFLESNAKKKFTEDFQQELRLLEGPANHLSKIEARGGYFVVTNVHVWFFPHGVNFQNSVLKLAISNIKSIRPSAMFGIIPNAIALDLEDGSSQTFIVSQRNIWISELQRIASNRSA